MSSHYKVSEYSLPLNFKLYLRSQFFGNKAKRHFKNKHELAIQLVDEFVPATETTYLLADAWYTSGKLMLHGLKRGYHTIGRIKSNRIIYPFGIKTSVKGFSVHIRKNETCPVTVGDNKYCVYRYEGKINDFKNAFILMCWSKSDLSDKPAFVISTEGKKQKLKTIGDTVGYFRQQYMAEVAKFTYSCAAEGVSLESMITKLGIAA